MAAQASVSDCVSFRSSVRKAHVALCQVRRVLQTWAPQMKGLVPGPVAGHSCVQLVTVLLLGILFLSSTHCDVESADSSSYETIIPESLAVKGSGAPVEEASYVLPLQGQKHVVHLRVNRDHVVSHFPVYSYHNGILGRETPSISRDCHYEGYIEGVPGSFVSVNTCSGLRGILIKEGTSYGIEPLGSSTRFEHMLYTMARQGRASCGVTSRDSQRVSTSWRRGHRKPHGQAASYLWSHTKYVEMFVVVDNQRFQMWGSNVSETVRRVVDVIALVNSFTRGINTQVVLAGMEIWTEGDLIEVPVDLQVTLRNFNSWRREQLLRRVHHDVAHMIVGHHPGESKGQAFLGGACSSGFAAAVESFHQEDAVLSAALMAHELGHNLGIQHDHSDCICKEKPLCLMHKNIPKESGFSDCSSDYYYHFLHEHKGACLFNKPGHESRKRRSSRCGNGMVEDPEQCDCGPHCDNHPCCDPTCQLKVNAQCSDDLCCHNCTFKRKGALCRPVLDECDLPEYCNGNSERCPKDSYKQDGTLCDRIYYCSGGQCKNPDRQCTNIYGYPARSAPEDCYISMHSKGNRFANCGRPTAASPAYVRCTGDDIFCGKLVCTGVEYFSSIKPQHTVIQVPYGDDWCWSVDAYNVTDISDYGDVQNGTYCAPNKVCMDSSCVDQAVLRYDCDPQAMCHGRGVCNNLRHCHCDDGFAPPDCRNPGNGGSVDSGPAGKPVFGIPIEDEIGNHIDGHRNARKESKKNENPTFGHLTYVFPLFIVALFLGLIIATGIGAGKEVLQCSKDYLEENPEVIIPECNVSKGQEGQEAEN